MSVVSVLDSGASHHMSPDSSSFTFVSPLSSIPVMTVDGTHMTLAGDLQSEKLIRTGRRENGLYILDELKVPVAATTAAAATSTGTLLSGTPEAPFSFTAPQTSSEIVDPPPSFIHCFYESSSYKEAIIDPLWQQAMDEELSIKTNFNGSIERYKARLVTKGYSQQYGMDYEEIFAPVAKMTTIHTLIVVTSIRRIILSLYIDDMIITGDDDINDISVLKTELA
ncbi:PREDICTED: uncharacterized protein LOC105131151 [Populus euphratica]|uniref:Uncharacterized protein LOC105131151 n=1 Tax=Populus euphratica TaxID=75702 RepID=A0AAJ6ULN9_POPEU|nr:PREDICTED: uncharacterized protein LOC105131151 [Populus euphratica]